MVFPIDRKGVTSMFQAVSENRIHVVTDSRNQLVFQVKQFKKAGVDIFISSRKGDFCENCLSATDYLGRFIHMDGIDYSTEAKIGKLLFMRFQQFKSRAAPSPDLKKFFLCSHIVFFQKKWNGSNMQYGRLEELEAGQ